MKTVFSPPIAGPEAGGQFVTTTAVWGCREGSGSFVAILEVRNSHGITETLGWQAGQLGPPDDSVEIGLDWVPVRDGEYELRTFGISSFENPEVLSNVVRTRDIWLGESPGQTVIAIPYDPDPVTETVTFQPSVVKVVLGINNTFVWTNGDNVSHRIIQAPDYQSSFDFNDVFLHPGQSFQHVFTQAGVLSYRDADRYWMRGIVYVIPHDAVNAYLNFSINGLKDSYKLDQMEPVEFSVDIIGFETGCGGVLIQVERIDAGRAEHPPVWSASVVYDCFRVEAAYRDWNLHLPSPERGPAYQVPINQTGTYRLTASFDTDFTSAHYSITREFVVHQ
ncbi:MAG: cupredoxin domain-containing protein [Nitrososphaera sp.]